MAVETPRLLITDDDADFREALRDAFEPRGLCTLTAGDGEEALRIVRSEQIHVVLLDMHMPKLSGLETLRRVKEFRALLPCILMSARLDDLLIEQARRARADLVLSKPFSLRQLTGAVERALERAYNWHVAQLRASFGHG